MILVICHSDIVAWPHDQNGKNGETSSGAYVQDKVV